MLKIIVCIKQVPNTDNVQFDWKKGALVRKGIENITNPDGLHAIEQALAIKEQYESHITAITMGPPQAEETLREAYALGVDNCVLITDKRFAGSDTYITSKILHKAIKHLGNFDIVITGFETLDGGTSQVSYQLAEFFDIPHFTQVDRLEISGTSVIIQRLYGHEYQKVKTDLPMLIAVKKELNSVRHARLIDIKVSFDKKITILNMEDIGGSAEEYGFSASPTKTLEGEVVRHKRKQERFEGTSVEKIEKLVGKLKKYGIIKY
ncbi:MAG: electron transfer flavoprotein subunit beta [Candidatus Lokiarchaeota archaeon]|nr:electron transfer flavoprotein subunit beta [Candidatus Lokiarchaeota archaeon]